jgi:hypothetical protein
MLINLKKGVFLNKNKLASVLDAFFERHNQITTDTDSYNFNPKSVDISGLLFEWRSVFEGAIVRMKIEELVRYWAVEVSADELLVALKMTVPRSAPEKIILSRLQEIFSDTNCNGFGLKGKLDLDKACFFMLCLKEYSELKMLIQAELAVIIFGADNLPGQWEQHKVIEKSLADFLKKKSDEKPSQAYSLFCWLEHFSNQLEVESYPWPGRQWLLGLMSNPAQRPSFSEMFRMWEASVRYPELLFYLQSAMCEDITSIVGHQSEDIPQWFLEILEKPEKYPHFLREAVLEKSKELRVFLRFDLDPKSLAEEFLIKETSSLPEIVLSSSPRRSQILGKLRQIFVTKNTNRMAKISRFDFKNRILALFP